MPHQGGIEAQIQLLLLPLRESLLYEHMIGKGSSP
jgi:hypothetical protein